ncbi:MAG TPA: hypothetical protein VGL13_15310 [Polyangiaceae bacterium]|jgi:hypothetical protein
MNEEKMRRFVAVLAVLIGTVLVSGSALAQEIQLTGPLAGAPAVRKLRYHRKGRFEIAPTVSFTLLDEFQRTIFVGGRLNYNLSDWLAIGVWAAGGAIHTTTSLTDQIDEKTKQRRATEPNGQVVNGQVQISVNNRLLAPSIGQNFKDQLGSIKWIASPQITLVPFRGKLAIFQKIFVDTDAYLFAGPAFVGLSEREDCTENCAQSFATKSRTQIAPTFGLGLSFYIGGLANLGLEWRAVPFAWNTGGFDTHGGAPDGRFPDNKITSDDREFKFNQVISINLGFSFPSEARASQ